MCEVNNFFLGYDSIKSKHGFNKVLEIISCLKMVMIYGHDKQTGLFWDFNFKEFQ